ncbi:MAG: hypothetical protein CVT99_10355 [Bacteroidetes bacterium HGW-Bacteroidetes-16]|nr:MAG: hypothetical protein CVT99_10355 [Bacteroidetes bacterium HGW-Bacteroidetes-16]
MNIRDAKLTSKFDKFVIEQAKEYVATLKRSLSRIIKSYHKSLVNRENYKKDDKKSEIPVMSPDEFQHSIKK